MEINELVETLHEEKGIVRCSISLFNKLQEEFRFMSDKIEQLEKQRDSKVAELEEIVADRTKDVMYYKEKFESLEKQLEKERNRFAKQREHYQKTMSWAENKFAELEEKTKQSTGSNNCSE
ncbi:MAG: hypothetical protein ACRC17_06365 [Culicoidibacterales bacterium]